MVDKEKWYRVGADCNLRSNQYDIHTEIAYIVTYQKHYTLCVWTTDHQIHNIIHRFNTIEEAIKVASKVFDVKPIVTCEDGKVIDYG